MDEFTQRRVEELRDEITSLQDQNQTYHLQESHTQAESDQQELRRLRLLAIKEELAKMIEALKGASDEAEIDPAVTRPVCPRQIARSLRQAARN